MITVKQQERIVETARAWALRKKQRLEWLRSEGRDDDEIRAAENAVVATERIVRRNIEELERLRAA